MKNLSIASIRTQVPGFYSADALTTMPRVPVAEQEFLSLKAFRSKAFSVAFPSCGLWWCRPHPVREHAQDLRPPLGARPASPPTRQAAQLPPRGPSTNPRPLV